MFRFTLCLVSASLMAGPSFAKDFVHVCQDAGAGAYEAFPDVCRLKDGRLMCVFYAGYGHVSLPNEAHPKGGRIACCYSSDEGKTWTPAETLYDGPNDDRDPSITQLKDGRLLCNFFSLEKTGEKKEHPWRGLGTWVVESKDLGKTWSEPQPISKEYYASAPIRELADGRLILGLYADNHGAVTISADKGKTWSKPIDIDSGGKELDAETDVIELANGNLFAALRGRKEMCWSTSEDGGKTWTVAESFGFPGHCPYLHRPDDGSIVMAFRLPQTSMRISHDEGNTWSDNIVVDDVGGAYPSMVDLDDSSVLIVYYEEGEGSSIRAKRFRVTDSGVEWLEL
jgi:predicted neuraminidase